MSPIQAIAEVERAWDGVDCVRRLERAALIAVVAVCVILAAINVAIRWS